MALKRKELKRDAVLSELMIRRMVADKYNAANKISPVITVSKRTDMYYVFDDSNSRLENTAADRKGGTNEVDFGFGTDTYRINDYGLKVYIHPDLLDDVDDAISSNIRQAASQHLTDLMVIDREYRCNKVFFNNTIMAGCTEALDNNSAVDNENSDFISLVDDSLEKVRMGAGIEANTWLMNKKIWRKVRRRPDLIKLMKDDSIRRLSLKDLAYIMEDQDFDLPNMVVAGQTYNTAPEGKTKSFADVWDPCMLFAYVNPQQKTVMENTFSKTFMRKQDGINVFFYDDPDPDKDGQYCKVKTNYGFKITNKSAGYLITNCLKTA